MYDYKFQNPSDFTGFVINLTVTPFGGHAPPRRDGEMCR